jgi:hypothetical protein
LPDTTRWTLTGSDVEQRSIHTAQELISLDGHQGGMLALAFSPNGSLLVSDGATRDAKGELFVPSQEAASSSFLNRKRQRDAPLEIAPVLDERD